jgi:flavin-dependent dehydrogenase
MTAATPPPAAAGGLEFGTGPDSPLDLLVVGGGPAGLAVALQAVRRGMAVAVAEPRPFPVDKACGEGIMPGGVRALRRMGIDPPGRPFAGIRYVAGGHCAEAVFRAGPGLGVRRTDLQGALGKAAENAGVAVLAARVTGLVQDGRGVTAATVPGSRPDARPRAPHPALPVRARWVVAADGLASPIRRSSGLDLPVRGLARYGLRRHFEVERVPEFVEVHWGAHAEAYVTPVADDTVGVALLTSERAPYAAQLARFGALSEWLAQARPVTPVRGAGPLRRSARRRVCGRVLLAGDAAGYVDALTGEGIALAFAGAEALVECLARGRPDDWEAEWRRLTRSYRRLTSGLLAVRRRPRLARGIVPAAAWFPGVFAAAVDGVSHG